jgi:ATP-dependent protease ClpP protease subunit
MTLHPVRISGTVIGAPQTYRYFKEMQERIADFVCRNCSMSRETFLSLVLKPDEMAADVGSILDGREAVALGLIDEVGGLEAAIGCLKSMIKNK